MRECISCCRRDIETSDISFFRFPKDDAKLKPWLESMGFDLDWKPLRGNFLCSLHFSNESFIGNHLKKDSVPTIFEDGENFEINYKPYTNSEISIEEAAVESFVFNYNETDIHAIKNEVIDIDDTFKIKKEPDIIEDAVTAIYIDSDVHETKRERYDLNDHIEEKLNFKIKIIKEEVVEPISIINSGADVHDNQKEIKNEPVNFSSEIAMNEEIPIYNNNEYLNDNFKVETQVEMLIIEEVKVDNSMITYKETNTDNGKLVEESDEEHIDVEVNDNYENFKRKNEEIDVSDVEGNTIEDNYPKNSEISTNYVKSTIVSTKPKHIKNKVIKKVFICDNCKTLFKNKSALIQHIQKHPKELTSCNDCSYKTYYTNDLKQHVNVKHIQKALICLFCNYETYYQNDLDKHIDTKHAIKKKFTCSVCWYSTYNKSEHSEHEHIKKPKRTRFSCTYCKYSSYYKKDLKRHVNSIHTKSITFSCPSCDYKAYRKTHLDLHINAKHSKIASFNCSLCSFKTFYKYDLNKHIRVLHP